MARRNFGSVEPLPSGRYRAYYKVEGRRVNAPHTFARVTDARHFLATVEADTLRQTLRMPTSAGKVTLTEYASSWNERPGIKETTRKDYESDLRNHLLPTLGNYRIDRIAPDIVRSWYNDLSMRTGEAALKRAYRTLSAIMGQAVNDEIISASPCKIRNGGKFKGAERPVLSIEELDSLTRSVPERYSALVHVLAWLAVRPGEACALRRSDLNLDSANPTVTIRRRVSTKTGTFAFDTPKTEAGNRTISVPPHLVPIIRKHLSEFACPEGDAIVFTTSSGNPAVDAGSRKIKQGLIAIGRPDVRAYDLRHTGQTLAAENGASLRELMHRMGHSSPNASLVYQHRTQDHGRETANRLSEKATNVVQFRNQMVG
jgi:integrase